MPIYTYKCAACGYVEDVMQKVSDAALSTCPRCGAESFAKQLTTAGFAFKGGGYYVTDFKNPPAKPEPAPACGASGGACPSCPAAS